MDTLVLKIDAQLSQSLKEQLVANQISNRNPYVAFAAKKTGLPYSYIPLANWSCKVHQLMLWQRNLACQ